MRTPSLTAGFFAVRPLFVEKTLYPLTVLLVLLTFVLLLLGGTVHNTASSLACPDWPLCYGLFLPPMKGNIAIEHSHRLLASSVGLLTLVLSLLIYKVHRKGRLVRLGFLAVIMVIVQGILGGLTVIYGLPDAVSTAHLGVSFLFFAMLLVLLDGSGGEDRGKKCFQWKILIAAVLVYLQCLLGAFVRHTGAGIVCPEFPLCYGSAWPTGVHPSVLLHMSHRWMALVVAVFVGWACWSSVFGGRSTRRSRIFGILIFILLLSQIALGAASVLTHLGQVPVTAHLGVAALLWGALVIQNSARI